MVLDNDYEPLQLMSGAQINRTFLCDNNGNIIAFGGRTYTYDSMDRLATHSGPDGDWEYDYNLNSNRSWHKLNTVQTMYN